MNRRGFLTGALAAPLVVTTPGLLMTVRKALGPSQFDLSKDFAKITFYESPAVSAVYSPTTHILTYTREDGSQFTVNMLRLTNDA